MSPGGVPHAVLPGVEVFLLEQRGNTMMLYVMLAGMRPECLFNPVVIDPSIVMIASRR